MKAGPIDRYRAALLGRETVEILKAGPYRAPSGLSVDIRGALLRARSATVEYARMTNVPPPPRDPPVRPRDGTKHCREARQGSFRHLFEHIVFAITDWSEDRRFIGPFERALGMRATSH